MYGQRQIFSCLAVALLLALLNFYKQAGRRDREHRQWAAANRRQRQLEQHARFMSHWLEYEDRCWDVHALVLRPEEIAGSEAAPDMTGQWNGTQVDNEDGHRQPSALATSNPGVACPSQKMPTEGTIHAGATEATDTAKSAAKPTSAPKNENRSMSGIVYVVVSVLLVSLGKAAYDLSKQISEANKNRTLTEDEMLRRCSLQEYSLIKHRQQKKQQQQQQSTTSSTDVAKAASAGALEPFLRKFGGPRPRLSIPHQMSLDSGAEVTRHQHSEFVRRLAANPLDYENGPGVPTEPGTPVKAGKLIAGRPVPLLRRCSVPVFLDSPHGSARRPSMDTFGEEDSAMETAGKRRVRMIHRH